MMSSALLRLARDANDLIIEHAPEYGALVPIIIVLSLQSYNQILPIELPDLFREAV